MSRRWLPAIAALAVLAGALVLTNTAFRRRQITRALASTIEGADRYVDVGVLLRVVVRDPSGEELLEGKPRLRVVREHRFGGMVDTKASTPRIVGPSQRPRTWLCSEEQEAIILHRDTDPLGQLVYGSEGAGKTTALVMWTYLRWLEHLGERREGGITAPTTVRVGLVLREIVLQYPQSWFTFKSSTNILTFCDGTRIRLVSTYRQSAAQGSPIQGFNWSWCARDEAQDQVDVHEDIESRGRAARLITVAGREVVSYKQLATATAKDDPQWRTLRDTLLASGSWAKRELSIFRSPFIGPDFLLKKRAGMSEREFRRRYGDPETGRVEDLAPELAVYPAWSREYNLVPLPDLYDVTAQELRPWAPQRAPIFSMLGGHDPGTLVDVTLLLKAYVRSEALYLAGKERPKWFVVGEVNTEQSTTEAHIAELLKTIRERWGLNRLASGGKYNPLANQILVRADPAGNSDNRTDKSVYTQFANAGITTKPAAYNPQNTGHGRVSKEAGIELVNTLFCSASGERRLFVVRNPDGSPVAPRLVAALESSERDLAGKAETQRKDKADVSHWPAALRYALWAIERPRLQLVPRDAAS